MDLQDELLTFGIGHDEDVGFFAHADLVADRVDGISLLVCVKCQVVKTAIGQTVAIILNACQNSRRTRSLLCSLHFVFLTLAIRFSLASVEMHLWMLLCTPLSLVMRVVGTTSWLRLPAST